MSRVTPTSNISVLAQQCAERVAALRRELDQIEGWLLDVWAAEQETECVERSNTNNEEYSSMPR